MTERQAELMTLGVEALRDRYDDVCTDERQAENDLAEVQKRKAEIEAEAKRRIDYYSSSIVRQNGNKQMTALNGPKRK